MTAIDWIIVVVAIGFGVWGYGHGLIVGALTLAGFAGGAVLGSRVGPTLLEGGSESPYAPLTALLGGLILGALFAVTMEGLAQGLRTRFVRRPAGGVVDAVGGSVLFAALALGLAWVFGAVALHTPGARDLRSAVQESAILRGLNELLPPSGPVLNVLNRIDPTPEVRGPEAKVAAPDAKIARDPEVRAAADGVVRVLGTACGLGVAGSGWVAGPGVVVTDAHVVAGQDDTTVQVRGEGPRLDAEAIWYDPRNDLAILRAPGVSGVPRLRLYVNAAPGASAAILGFPEDGPYDVRPGRLGQTSNVISQDAYGRGPVRRSITSVRGLVRSGNSGGPVVDAAGRVVTTIFAASVSDGGQSGFGVPDSIVREALGRAEGPVDTGPCAR
jgi:Trypsin-like peptidase domain/Colicin V production protein